jgi:beta-N-acetylhexosaminidase
MRHRWMLSFVLFLALTTLLFGPALTPQAVAQSGTQTPTPLPQVLDLLQNMSPEERVGQLFLVTFNGTDAGPDSQVYDLIVNHHIGGIVLQSANDNFVAAPDTVQEAYRLIGDLQRAEQEASVTPLPDSQTGQYHLPPYIPLFAGIAQDGGGYPYDQILNGLTPLPNPMAIGATWKPDLAGQVGSVMGQELAALGFNLYIGPSLDVLETPNPTGSGDLGTRVFGGDPYWVGEMGRAYISGLHTGSSGRLLVVAKHFPGRGSSDRPPEEEVATVRKSLEQLKQIELAPFFAVTGNAPTPETTTDGLLVSHIRYQGFQGNIRATTKPVSFDPQALGQIMALPQFASWRDKGGLIVSDDLGSKAVRQFYDPSGNSFSARLVARDAFLAGNDLLYLGNIQSSDAPDTYTSVLRTLDYFAQKYREDSAFAQRVDAAVTRILTAKYHLYGTFALGQVLPSSQDLKEIGTGSQVSFDVARQAVTLISPGMEDLDTVLPSPPSSKEYMVFITDTQQATQCSTCSPQPTIAVDALQQAIVRLYGPGAGGQVFASHLASYSFDDLTTLLESGESQYLEDNLRRADWVILLMSDATNKQPDTIRRFLSDRQDLLRNKRIVLFSFGASYYLDATDISKLTAYFGLYCDQAPFVEVAARLLYQELTPQGASPVSIPSLGYDLISITSPDPDQVISLSLDLPQQPQATQLTVTPEPTEVPLFRVGDTISVRTGVIVDHNGNPVPDGTPVRFSLVLNGEGGGILQQSDVTTSQGVARASFRLEKSGPIEIHASSEPATTSEILQLSVPIVEGAAVTVIAPFPTATEGTPEIVETPLAESGLISSEGYPRFGGWVLALAILGLGIWLAYWFGDRRQSQRWGVRWALCVLLGGLAAYDYLVLGLPGGEAWLKSSGAYGLVGLTLLGEMLGWGGAWLWSQRTNAPKSQSD